MTFAKNHHEIIKQLGLFLTSVAISKLVLLSGYIEQYLTSSLKQFTLIGVRNFPCKWPKTNSLSESESIRLAKVLGFIELDSGQKNLQTYGNLAPGCI